jgi:UTP--glucose-1-phosphate uridylyltransferase
MEIKGVIVSAGYGTRFLPSTKTVPKELLPLLDTPSIEFIVKEFVSAGIKDILIISSRRKKVLEDYFDIEYELHNELQRLGKEKLLPKIEPIAANIFFVRQKRMGGTADAILTAKPFVGNSPFIVAFPDDVYIGNKESLSSELISAYKISKKNVLVIEEIDRKEVNRYGIVRVKQKKDEIYEIEEIVEKPSIEDAPSNLAAFGRYLLLPDIFPLLEDEVKNNSQKEAYHTNAINKLAKDGKVVAIKSKNERYDLGEPISFLKANILYVLKYRKEYKREILDFIRSIKDEYKEER